MKFKNYILKLKNINKKKLIIAVVLLLIVISCASIFGNRKKAEEKQEAKNVKVEKAAIGSISTEVEYASKLAPVQEITVFPKASGKVSNLKVDIGDKVTAGQVLFTLETAELQTQLQAQEAGLEAATANLERTSDSSLAQQISQAEQGTNKARISYNNIKDNYEKIEKLYSAGAVSKKELDDLKAQLDAATVDLKTAEENLSLLTQKIGPQSTRAAAAQVSQAQAGVSSAQLQLNNATVTSPISGVVSAKTVKVGEFASIQSGSITVIDNSSFISEVSVPDKVVGKLQIGQTVNVSINALDNKKITGLIDKISPNSNSKDNSYTVKIKIDNSTGELTAGMFIKVSLPSEKRDNILTVPNEAIKMENNVNYLYIVENGKVKKVSVDIGICDEKFTEVNGKIKEGSEIITEGQNLLNNGDTVKIAK